MLRYTNLVLPKFGKLTKSVDIKKEKKRKLNPSQRLKFTVDNTISGDLLSRYVAKKEQVTFEEAKIRVEEYIRHIKVEIYNNKTVQLSDLGYFRLDEENSNKIFYANPDAILDPQFYGLGKIEKPKTKPAAPVVAKAIEPKTPAFANVSEQPKEKEKEEDTSPKRRFWWIWAVAIFCLALILVAKSVFDVFPSDEKPVENQSNGSMYVFIDLSDLKWVSFEGLENEQEEELTYVSPNKHIEYKSKKGYIIVFGVFQSESNAKKLQKRLAKSFGSTEITDYKALSRVSSPVITSKKDAETQLKKAKQVNRGAWLLKID
ncbi:MAG: SPOR domain-containing protein [Flavobacteriales bacterium]